MITPHSAVSAAPPAGIRPITDLTVLGERTSHRAVQMPGGPPQVWLADTPECPVLSRFHMLHLGVVDAVAPYRFMRRRTRAVEFLACFGGEGRILVNGAWATFGPGTAALLPQDVEAGYFAVGDQPWRLVWVCYRWPAGLPPLLTTDSAALAAHDPMPLLHAVEGLRHECVRGGGEREGLEHWCSLIHLQILRFAHPWRVGDRLHALWASVSARLGEEWTLGRLAAEAGCCGEALRRRCLRQTGRSPMQHLTYLRLQHAAGLLTATDHKVETIAADVGYGDAFAFSAMFKKWTGLPPREFRERRRGGGVGAGVGTGVGL